MKPYGACEQGDLGWHGRPRGKSAHLERVTTVGLSVYHLHDLLVDRLSCLVPISPVVTSSHAVLADIEVLGVVYVFVWACLNPVDDLTHTLATQTAPGLST